MIDDASDWIRVERILEPEPSTAEVYADLYARYRDLYPLTADAMHALARLGAS
jgi:xylulokinase